MTGKLCQSSGEWVGVADGRLVGVLDSVSVNLARSVGGGDTVFAGIGDTVSAGSDVIMAVQVGETGVTLTDAGVHTTWLSTGDGVANWQAARAHMQASREYFAL